MATRCPEINPDGQQCHLQAGHDGDHQTAPLAATPAPPVAPRRSRTPLVIWSLVFVIVAFVALYLGGTKPAPVGGEPAAGVPWSDYAPELRPRIDGLARSRDCSGLQAEFDVADANNDSTRARTGHSNAELMKYIDGQMRSAGCY